jgi:hypothetical protein
MSVGTVPDLGTAGYGDLRGRRRSEPVSRFKIPRSTMDNRLSAVLRAHHGT